VFQSASISGREGGEGVTRVRGLEAATSVSSTPVRRCCLKTLSSRVYIGRQADGVGCGC